MIPTADIRTRVATVASFTKVRGVAALTGAIERQQFANGEAYVGVIAKRAGKNSLTNAVDQQVTATISVMYWLQDASDATGEKVSDENETVVDELQAALLNWSPDPTLYTPFLYAGGKLISFMPPAALYAEEFTTTLRARKTS